MRSGGLDSTDSSRVDQSSGLKQTILGILGETCRWCSDDFYRVRGVDVAQTK